MLSIIFRDIKYSVNFRALNFHYLNTNFETFPDIHDT